MGQAQSEQARNVSTGLSSNWFLYDANFAEKLSHELALRFARKCFTALEITHFKDIFRTLADDQDGIHYWKEETLCRFLVIPDALGPGPVINQMATYLGAFPFPSLAPSILTADALLKVVVVMTERYGRILKRGRADRNKLLFRSLAVFDRRMSSAHERPSLETAQMAEEYNESLPETKKSHFAGFSIDEPGDENEDEDDDELALAALESLDAIEVFKHDQRSDTKIHHAQIPLDNFRSLLMLLLVIAPLNAQESLSRYAESLSEERLKRLRRVADNILWAFAPEENAGVFYHSFNSVIPASLPYLFDGFNPLFEHFLFSKNLDLSRHKRSSSTIPSVQPAPAVSDTPFEPLLQREGEVLDSNVLSQLSFFLRGETLFRRLRPLYFGGEAGFSIGSFEQKVFNWRAPTTLLVAGTRLTPMPTGGSERAFTDSLPPKRFPDSAQGNVGSGRVVFGAYLNVPWKHTHKEAIGDQDTLLFQLEPVHEVFRASAIGKDYITFSKSGIGIGSPVAPTKPVSGLSPHKNLGPVSLMLDESLEYGVFTHDSGGGGSFHPSQSRKSSWQDRFEIESLEVWGCGGDEEAARQRAAWAFEDREAEARKGVKLGRDVEADRALLEMAGLVGNHNASGGSMG
ncbi:Restriction of telomere capping protein 5 [Loxospora ochrophaea]|nr:Restriction of telomere capping protein 5 [Loxospora ochrophaea]